MTEDASGKAGGDQIEPEALRAKLKRYCGTEAAQWVDGLTEEQLREHAADLCNTFNRPFKQSTLPVPNAVVDHRSGEEQRVDRKRIILTLLLRPEEVRSRLTQAGLKRHGMDAYDLYVTKSFSSFKGLCDAVANKRVHSLKVSLHLRLDLVMPQPFVARAV